VLNQDFKEFIQSLNDNGVRYLVVGGYAVALHGYPRYTKDMDVWVEMTAENASKIVKALNQFGFGSLDLKESDFIEPDQIIQLGYPLAQHEKQSLDDYTFIPPRHKTTRRVSTRLPRRRTDRHAKSGRG